MKDTRRALNRHYDILARKRAIRCALTILDPRDHTPEDIRRLAQKRRRTPCVCSCQVYCCNRRRSSFCNGIGKLTYQERKALDSFVSQMEPDE